MHCPEIEALVDLTVELLVRSAQDPGSSFVTSELVGNINGPTQYSVKIPARYIGLTCNERMTKLKSEHDATFIGLCREETLLATRSANTPTDNPCVQGRNT